MHIGVFDSGLGGLTVVRALHEANLPISITYLGDVANCPYGIKSLDQVQALSVRMVNHLLARNVDAIVIACNTATVAAQQLLQTIVTVPVFGMVGPGAQSAVRETRNKRVAIIATETTVRSRAYTTTIQAIDNTVRTREIAASPLVMFAENNNIGSHHARMALRNYAREIEAFGADVLVLGCTHFPLFQQELQRLLPNRTIIDPAIELVADIQPMISSEKGTKDITISVTRKTPHFDVVAQQILTFDVDGIEVLC